MLNRRAIVPILLSVSLFFVASCSENDEDGAEQTDVEVTNLRVPKVMSFQIVKEYPHDVTAFTEGLEYIDGHMYESVGHYGKSDIRKTELETGKIVQQQKMDAKYFGEGMTVLNDKIYQLTYQERTGFVYDKESFKLLKTFSYNTKEGWGMTNDGTHLIYGDGETSLIFLDPATLKEVKRMTVTDQYGSVAYVNELEYINGFIYANQWRTNLILKIDPANGEVIARADLTDLRRVAGIPEPVLNDESAPEVLNGIAYDKTGNRIFITGKNWPKIFEIKLDN